jgi:hypothetical protein
VGIGRLPEVGIPASLPLALVVAIVVGIPLGTAVAIVVGIPLGTAVAIVEGIPLGTAVETVELVAGDGVEVLVQQAPARAQRRVEQRLAIEEQKVKHIQCNRHLDLPHTPINSARQAAAVRRRRPVSVRTCSMAAANR